MNELWNIADMYSSYRRHSTAETLTHTLGAQRDVSERERLRALQCRRSSVAEILSSSSNRLLAAISASDIYEGYLTYEKWSLQRATAKYTKVGEHLRLVIPAHVQCSVACGGRQCKYENPLKWSKQDQAVEGLYSSCSNYSVLIYLPPIPAYPRITEHILAMARPSSQLLEQHSIIQRFKDLGIHTVINLQHPGEHASCGPPLELQSGFTYLPDVFMKNKIYFYNFMWKDYGVASLTAILDMVKVIAFALHEGKVAIHCHAGLGRTGVLIACYLVFATRMSADHAVLFVRVKRPNAIQTRGQLLCVREFTQFLQPLWSVYGPSNSAAHPATLSQYLVRQRYLLYGLEARQLKHLPKPIYLICNRLNGLAECTKPEQRQSRTNHSIQALANEIQETLTGLSGDDVEKEIQNQESEEPTSLQNSFSPERTVHKFPTFKPPTPLKKKLSYSDSDLRHINLIFLEDNRPSFISQNNSALKLRQERHEEQRGSQKFSVVNHMQGSAPVQMHFGHHSHRPMGDSRSSIQVKRQREFKRSQTIADTSLLQLEKPIRLPLELSTLPVINIQSPSDRSDSGSTTCDVRVQTDQAVPGLVLTGNSQSRSLEGGCSASSGEHIKVPLKPPGHIKSQEPESHTICRICMCEPAAVSKHLAVAHSLSHSLEVGEGKWQRVLGWQQDLNSSEESWERLQTEEDPVILSGLLWSWLEQLKEPVLSETDLLRLTNTHKTNPLELLEKGQIETLLCVMDCIAALRDTPAEVEQRLLGRMIQAFTWVKPDEGMQYSLHKDLRNMLQSVIKKKANSNMLAK